MEGEMEGGEKRKKGPLFRRPRDNKYGVRMLSAYVHFRCVCVFFWVLFMKGPFCFWLCGGVWMDPHSGLCWSGFLG